MRAAPLFIAALGTLAAGRAIAEPLPSGSIGAFLGGALGTGADAKALGRGYMWGVAAAWQPMTTDQRVNWAAKWSASFGTMYDADAARLGEDLVTVQMDLMPGIRLRPGESRARYLTLRAGGSLLRTNQVIPDRMQRAFVGGIASIGYDHYAAGWLFNVDVRYSLIGAGPTSLGLVIGISRTGP